MKIKEYFRFKKIYKVSLTLYKEADKKINEGNFEQSNELYEIFLKIYDYINKYY